MMMMMMVALMMMRMGMGIVVVRLMHAVAHYTEPDNEIIHLACLC